MKLELINEFSKLPRVKINTQKSVVFLYTSNEHKDTGIKNITLSTMIQNKVKILKIT